MYWDHMTGWGWTMMIFWSFIWVALLGFIIWVGVNWSRNASPAAPHPPASEPRPSARELLDQRLASGEINVEEYRERKAALDDHPSGSAR